MGQDAERRLLFFMLRINFDRAFENLLRELLGRGHIVTAALDRHKAGLPDHATYVFESLAAEYPGFSYEMAPITPNPWERLATGLRVATDYLRYLEPAYADANALRARVEARTPRWARRLAALPVVKTARGRAILDRLLRMGERSLPPADWIRSYMEAFAPDVILVTPLVGVGSSQGDYIRVARELGIPSVLPVASWDNLSNKGVIRDQPDRTIVWNPAQLEEAASLQRLPAETTFATGAHSWDHWFDWVPSTTFAEFTRRRGLAPDQALILYVCSSNFIASDEVDFVREWLERLRSSGDPRLRDAGVILRPHPQNTVMWADTEFGDPRALVWPREGAAPTNDERKNDYYDSLHHASAVVGINTSAQVEAAIVRTPVLTLLLDRFHETQQATLHFSHLRDLLIVADSWETHLAQLSEALAGPADTHDERLNGFVRTFIRPNGLDTAAAPAAADLIEAAAGLSVPAPRTGLLAHVMRWMTPMVERRERRRRAQLKAKSSRSVNSGRAPSRP